MDLNNIDISKLPADVRKQFKRYQVMHAEKKIQNKAKDDFLSFVKCMWPDFIEGSHHVPSFRRAFRITRETRSCMHAFASA